MPPDFVALIQSLSDKQILEFERWMRLLTTLPDDERAGWTRLYVLTLLNQTLP